MNNFTKFIEKHSSAILTGMSIIGVGITTGLAINSTIKAVDIVNKKTEENCQIIGICKTRARLCYRLDTSEEESAHLRKLLLHLHQFYMYISFLLLTVWKIGHYGNYLIKITIKTDLICFTYLFYRIEDFIANQLF